MEDDELETGEPGTEVAVKVAGPAVEVQAVIAWLRGQLLRLTVAHVGRPVPVGERGIEVRLLAQFRVPDEQATLGHTMPELADNIARLEAAIADAHAQPKERAEAHRVLALLWTAAAAHASDELAAAAFRRLAAAENLQASELERGGGRAGAPRRPGGLILPG